MIKKIFLALVVVSFSFGVPDDKVERLYHAEIINLDDIAKARSRGAVLIDIRTPEEWSSTGVIDGSKKIISFDADDKLDMSRFEKELKQHNISKDDEILLICRSGNRSVFTANELVKLGYTNVKNVTFGIKSWIMENRPLSSGFGILENINTKKANDELSEYREKLEKVKKEIQFKDAILRLMNTHNLEILHIDESVSQYSKYNQKLKSSIGDLKKEIEANNYDFSKSYKIEQVKSKIEELDKYKKKYEDWILQSRMGKMGC